MAGYLIAENRLPLFISMDVAFRAAVGALADEVFQCPLIWTKQAHPKLIHYDKLDKGGHRTSVFRFILPAQS